MKRPNHEMDRATSANRVGLGVTLIRRELRLVRADFAGTFRQTQRRKEVQDSSGFSYGSWLTSAHTASS